MTAARILVIEDSDAIRLPVLTALRAQGFEVTACADGADVESRLAGHGPDLVVLDVMLPGRDGFALLEVIRRTSRAAVVMLTARDALPDRVQGLAGGADDYLVKPFAMAELVARIHAVLRRTRPGGSVVSIEDLEISDDGSLVRRGGEALDLTDTERRLLGYLAAHRDRVVSKTQLLTAIWGYDGFDENVVEVHVSALRRKLETGGRTRLVHTVRGRGYRAGGPSVTSAPAPPRTVNRLDTVSLRLRVTAAVLAVLAVTLVLLSVTVSAVFAAQSNRTADALLASRSQLARQLASAGLGPMQIINRVSVDGVQARLVLRNGTAFGSDLPIGSQVRTTTLSLSGNARVDGSVLTLAVDTSLVNAARRTLRRVLIVTGLGALVVSGLLVAGTVQLALRPLGAMAQLAKTVAGGNRGFRLAPSRTDTELGQTAQAFDEMLDELEGAESRARQAEERTRAFLADAAHELRTPIAGVQAAAETLLHHSDDLDAAQQQRLQALLVREAQRAGTLVSDLLAAARLDAGIDLDLAPVSLPGLVQADLDRLRLLHPEMTLTMTGSEVVARADAARVSSILRNVLENAVRAAGHLGKVHVGVREAGAWAVVDVWDTGPGVPAADRERIFERLVRLEVSRAQDAGGSGLGLAIARGYARAHGGDLACEDPRGPGALFRLTLPLHPRTS